jgi:hypothetical protein
MKEIRFTLIFLGSLALFSLSSGFTRVGTTAASFLKIGAGARPCGMGEAFVAVAEDVTALFWNPSGIVQCRGTSVAAGYNLWFAGIRHGFAGSVLRPTNYDALGVFALYLNSGDIEITTAEEPEGTGLHYTHSDLSLGVTYSRYLSTRFAFGATVKYIQENVAAEQSQTLALDLGSLYRTGWNDLRIGMVLQNFGGKMRLDGRDLYTTFDPHPGYGGNPDAEGRLSTDPWALPVTFKIGVSARPLGPDLLLSVDGIHLYDSSERLHLGAEYSLAALHLRAGYRVNSDEGGLSLGAGFQVGAHPEFRLDYAAQDMGRLGFVHRVGLIARL